MTLTEAIKHCEDVADYDCFTDDQRKCSEEHRQLADWLRELKERREKDMEVIKQLPSAQPVTHEERTKTHACDLISRQAAIDVEGLDEQIRCEMCRNPMHTNRGCDGNCKYDEKLYERIMQILGERIKPLPSAEPEIIRCRDCKHHDGIRCFRWNSTIITGFDDFCSNAERRTDE